MIHFLGNIDPSHIDFLLVLDVFLTSIFLGIIAYSLAFCYLRRNSFEDKKNMKAYKNFKDNVLSTSLFFLVFFSFLFIQGIYLNIIPECYWTISGVWLSMFFATFGWMIHVKNNHILNRKKQTSDLLSTVRDKHRDDFIRVYERFPPGTVISKKDAKTTLNEVYKKGSFSCEHQKMPVGYSIMRILDTYEMIAAFLDAKLIDKQLVENVAKTSIVNLYSNNINFIDLVKERYKSETAYSNLYKLVEEGWADDYHSLVANRARS